MYTSSGLAAGARDDPRQAVLWFAYAARLAGDDRERADANRTRAAAWGRLALQPVRALESPAGWIENNMAFHPDGRHLLTHRFHGETYCQLWDLGSEAQLPFPGNLGTVSTAVWDAAGERLAVGTPKGEVTICRFPSGEVVQRLPGTGCVARLLFSPDGRYCALAAAHRVRVWDCRQAAFATPELEHPAPVTKLAFDPKGELLATGCEDNFCRVYTVPATASAPLFTPVTHQWGFMRQGLNLQCNVSLPLLFLDEGRGLLTVQDDVSLRDPRTGRILRVLPTEPKHSGAVARSGDGKHLVQTGYRFNAVARSADGKHLAVSGYVSDRPDIHIYDVASAQPVSPNLEHRVNETVTAVAFRPDGQMLVTGGRDQTARLWSVPKGKPLGAPLTHSGMVSGVRFTPDGRHLATAQSGDNSGGLIRLWALPAGRHHEYRVPVGAESFVRLSRDGRYLLPAGLTLAFRVEGPLRSTQVFDLVTGQRVGRPLDTDGIILDAAFSPDGLQVATAVCLAASAEERAVHLGQLRGQLLLWDWRAGKLQHEPLPLPSEPRKLDYSPDGRQLAVLCADGELRVIDPATGKTLRQWQAHPPHLGSGGMTNNGAVRFSPDNGFLLTFGTGTNSVRIWDARTGQLRRELQHQGKCNDVQFSSDGRLVATAGYDSQVCVWELATGRQLARLTHPAEKTYTALFSPDDKLLLTACRDGMARLWDWRAGRLVCPPFEHEHQVSAVAFTPDGRHVLSASADGILKAWEWHTGKPVCPPLDLGGAGLSLAVTPDGRRVAVGGLMNALPVFRLDKWLTPAPLDRDDLCLWGEIVSGQRIEDGGGVTNLTAEEWLDRWRDFLKRHPAPALSP
jgi:WD40 repeat protein